MPRSSPPPKKGISKAASKPSTPNVKQGSELLTIPLELRQEIYGLVARNAYDALLKLMVVCRRMAAEVKPFLYKRTFSFDGQSELYSWLDKHDPGHLCHVVDIRFKLVDIDPETIIGALGKRLRVAKEMGRDPEDDDNPYYEACFQDLKRLQAAFTLFIGLRKLAIIACHPSDPQPPARMKDGFSKMLGTCFKGLHSLISEERLFPVHFIANKPHLRRLRFPASTNSSEKDIAMVFRKLSNLRLEICRPRFTSSDDLEYDDGCLTESLSYVPPLSSLTLVGAHDLLEEAFVDSFDVVKRQLRTLRQLTIIAEPPHSMSQERKMAITRNVWQFIHASNLQHIEVVGFFLREFPTMLSHTVQTFILRLDTWSRPRMGYQYQGALRQLSSSGGQRPMNKTDFSKWQKLKEVQVWVIDDPANLGPEESDGDENDGVGLTRLFDHCQYCLERVGLKLRVVVNRTDMDVP